MKRPVCRDVARASAERWRPIVRLAQFAALWLVFGVLGERDAVAQAYPSKPVRLIVAVGAGGADDFQARIVASKLSELLGQQLIVENRPGAGGQIGETSVAKSAPDGYTLLFGGGSMTGARYIVANLGYDVLRDFSPVSLISTSPYVMLVHPSVPTHDVKAFVALARTRPGRVSFATTGMGTGPYWAGTLFSIMGKIQAIEVPYKGAPAAVVDLIGGQVDYYFGSPVTALSNKAKTRLLAVTSATRSPMFPDVPAIAETLPGYDITGWNNILGPAGMRPEVVDALNAAIRRSIAAPDVRDRFLKAGFEPTASTTDELAKRIADWVERFGKIAKQAGIKPQ